MGKTKPPIPAKVLQKTSFFELCERVETRIRDLRRQIGEGPFKWSQLTQFVLTGNAKKDSPLITALYKRGIIKPSQKRRRVREAREYTFSDVEHIVFANELKSKKYNFPQIEALIDVWHEWSQHARRDPSVEIQMNETDRAQLMLLGRLLAIVTSLICGYPDAPNNSIVIIRRVKRRDGNKLGFLSVNINTTTSGKVSALLTHDISDDIVRGICTSSIEVLAASHQTRNILSSLEGRTFYEIQVPDFEEKGHYEIILGFAKGISINLNSVNANIRLESEKFVLLLHLLRYMFSSAIHLREVIQDTGRPLNILHALAEAIIHIAPKKWSYCGVLTPKNFDSYLKAEAWSSEFPNALQNDIFGINPTYSAGLSLPAWVYKSGDPTAINSVVDNDPRIPRFEVDQIAAAAAVPALVGEKIVGVIYVASHKTDAPEINCFEKIDMKLLRVFGQIVGEAIERDNNLRESVRGALNMMPKQSIEVLKEHDLEQDIRVAVSRVFNSPISLDTPDSLVVLTIQIAGEVFFRQEQIASWISEKVRDKTYHFLENELHYDTADSNSFKVYKFDSSQYVALLSRTKANHRHLRQELEKDLSLIKGFGTKPIQIKNIDVWSLEFKYNDMYRKIKMGNYSQDKLSNELFSKIQGSLEVLLNIRQGNRYISEGKYNEASFEFERANDNKPLNPYVLRHLAICKSFLREYNDAVHFAQKAVDLDPNYAGSHIVLGDALIAQGNYKEAVNHYEEAKKLNPNHPSPRLGYGQALVFDGDPNRLDEALKEIEFAMSQDESDLQTKIKYLRLNAEACIIANDFDRAMRFLDQASRSSPDDREISFMMKIADNFALNTKRKSNLYGRQT